MLSRSLVIIYAWVVLLAMTWVSWYASTTPTLTSLPAYAAITGKEAINVIDGFVTVCSEPWGLATMFDAYFGFLAFFLYVAWRECTTAARVGWFVALMLLGNFAIVTYLLLALRATPGETDLAKVFFTAKKA